MFNVTPARILVVDDDETMRGLLALRLPELFPSVGLRVAA